jgi:hypothetical protein
MDTSKLITVVVWGTILLVAYEAISAVLKSTAATATAEPSALSGLNLSQALGALSGLNNVLGNNPATIDQALNPGDDGFNVTGPGALTVPELEAGEELG